MNEMAAAIVVYRVHPAPSPNSVRLISGLCAAAVVVGLCVALVRRHADSTAHDAITAPPSLPSMSAPSTALPPAETMRGTARNSVGHSVKAPVQGRAVE